MGKDDYAYQLFQLKNKEFTYTVDDSKLGCGLDGALYFVQMDADGGKSKYSNAGASHGLGYCDAQCPHDLKFINGEANAEDWKPSETDVNAGTGKYGSCCTEIDIWKRTPSAQPTPCTPAPLTDRRAVRAPIAETTVLIVSRVCATRTVATSSLTALATRTSLVLARNSRLIPPSQSP